MHVLDQLLGDLREACAAIPDKRKSEGVYSMADIGLSAFSLFFMRGESFLSYQRALEEGCKTSNCQTLFGMARIPTDNHIRSMLDPVHPSYLQPVFDKVNATLDAHGGLEPFQRLCGRTLVALIACPREGGGPRSRIASPMPPNAGSPPMPCGWRRCGRFIWATISSPASPSPRRCWRVAPTSCSPPSPTSTRRCMTS